MLYKLPETSTYCELRVPLSTLNYKIAIEVKIAQKTHISSQRESTYQISVELLLFRGEILINKW